MIRPYRSPVTLDRFRVLALSLPVSRLPVVTPDWSFARRPFWLFSHVFAATVVVSFVLLGFWQLSRHQERADRNAQIESRSSPPVLDLAQALDRPLGELDYQVVQGRGTFVNDAVVRVANRSQGGVAGQHLVATFRIDGGPLILVNRGFVPIDTAIPVRDAPSGEVTVKGWLRTSIVRGWYGATDDREGTLVPRLDVAAIEARLDEPVAPVWLQLDGDASGSSRSTFPDPVPLPPLDGGPHLSYMAQWFIFATLGTLFYLALLRRQSRSRPTQGAPDAQTPTTPLPDPGLPVG